MLRDRRFCDAVDEGVEFGLGEAVEEEVSDDEIVGAYREGRRVRRSGGVRRRVFASGLRLRSVVEELKHGGAGVDGVGVELWVLREKLGEKATVSVAQDQGPATAEKMREDMVAAVFECPCRE